MLPAHAKRAPCTLRAAGAVQFGEAQMGYDMNATVRHWKHGPRRLVTLMKASCIIELSVTSLARFSALGS